MLKEPVKKKWKIPHFGGGESRPGHFPHFNLGIFRPKKNQKKNIENFPHFFLQVLLLIVAGDSGGPLWVEEDGKGEYIS